MPNRMGGTGLVAMHCAIGTDPAPFGCHHGMLDGEPARVCAGWIAARQAPFESWQAALLTVLDRPEDDGPDDVRDDFDHWWPTVDPEQRMDVYELGRAYALRARHAQEQRGEGNGWS